MIKRVVLFCGVALAMALMAGCGEDSSAGSTNPAQFAKEADAICEEIAAKNQVDFGKFIETTNLKKPTPETYRRLVDEVVAPNVEEEVEQIRDLGIPDGDEEEVEAILEGRELAAEEAIDDPKSFAVTNGAMFDESSKLAREYGLKACGVR